MRYFFIFFSLFFGSLQAMRDILPPGGNYSEAAAKPNVLTRIIQVHNCQALHTIPGLAWVHSHANYYNG